MKCIHCFVSGKVQGVWYRGSTQNQAEQLRLTGYARNLADGRVEVLVCGEADKLESLHKWLWRGPTAAVVSDVVCNAIDTPREMPKSFTTR